MVSDMAENDTNAQVNGMDEKQLLKACLDGDIRAQKHLYDYHAPKMFGICLRYAPDSDTAADILQDGFIRIFDKLQTFRQEGSLEGWMRRIMVNTALGYLRRNDILRRAVALDDTFSGPETTHEDENSIELPNQQTLLRLIADLPPGFRTVFNLYAIDNLPHSEIARLLGISEGTSKSQYARARAWLRKRITDLNP